MNLFARWDQRNQRVLETQNVRWLARLRRASALDVIVTSPSGPSYRVVARPSGYPLGGFDIFAGSGHIVVDVVGVVVSLVVVAVSVARNHLQFRRGWTVAVLYNDESGPWWRRGARVVSRDRVRSEADAIARVSELNLAISSGNWRRS